MKRISRVLAVALVAIVMASCSSVSEFFRTPDEMSIQKGMTKDEVVRLMGMQPTFRSFSGNVEELGFTIKYSSEDYIKVVNVTFENGLVTGMTSYPLPKVPEAKQAEKSTMPPSTTQRTVDRP